MVSTEGVAIDLRAKVVLYLHARKLLSTNIAGKWPLSRMNAEVSSQVLSSRKDPPAAVAG